MERRVVSRRSLYQVRQEVPESLMSVRCWLIRRRKRSRIFFFNEKSLWGKKLVEITLQGRNARERERERERKKKDLTCMKMALTQDEANENEADDEKYAEPRSLKLTRCQATSLQLFPLSFSSPLIFFWFFFLFLSFFQFYGSSDGKKEMQKMQMKVRLGVR